MLKNHCIVEYYKYDINLIKPISYICHLTFDILSISVENPHLNQLFKEDFIANARIDLGNLPENVKGKDAVSWLADQLALFFVYDILNKISLQNTSILLIHHTTKLLYALNKSKKTIERNDVPRSTNLERKKSIKNTLAKLIQEQKLIKLVADNILDEKIRNCVKNSILLDIDEIYSNCVTINDADVPCDVPYFEYSYLNQALTSLDPTEESDILLNKEKFKTELKIDIGDEAEVSIVKTNTSQNIGIKYNNYVFPLKSNLNEFIIEDKKIDFYWIQVKEVFKVDESNKVVYKSEIINDFKFERTKKYFTNLLSYLRQNLYLDNEILSNSQYHPFKKYFTSSLKIQEVKYLKKLNFFIKDSEQPASFGIYSSDKLEEDSNHFNLVHWFDQTTAGKNQKYRDSSGPKAVKDVYKVSTLKPEIAFYFITKYFEDFVEDLLNKINDHSISNFHLFNGNEDLGEFDFLVKGSEAFYFIEVKTTLTKYNISDYNAKCLKVIEAFKNIGVNLEFIIIGAYSHLNVEDLKHYIIKSHQGNKRYNTKIDELNTIPYNFKIPIEKTDKKLLCIAESNYSLLKTLLKKCLK